jgi:type IX secretion system PorP/SprF family membrane protein
MKYLKTLLILISSFTYINLNAQDATFAQWEHIPQHFNPALVGDFEGSLKFRAKHRNQWQSVLGANSFRTSAAAAEYKFKSGNKRKFNIGFHTLFDKAGAASFKTKTFNLSTSLVQKLNDKHSIAIGFTGGLGNNSVNLADLNWGTPNSEPIPLNSSVNYALISTGVNWKYVSDSHFGFHLGSALLNVNKPNISFSGNESSRLSPRFNLHGNIELPLAERFSFVPSALYSKQNSANQLLFGLYNKFYLDANYAHSFQLGAFAKTANYLSESAVNVYVLSATLEFKRALFAFSFERFTLLQSNTFEFSAGYTLTNK